MAAGRSVSSLDAWLGELATRLDGGLETLLTAQRGRPNRATAKEASEDEDALKALYSRLRDRPPDGGSPPGPRTIDRFIESLDRFERALRSFERELHLLSEDEDFAALVDSFEDLLKEHASLLGVLELVIGLAPAPPNPEAVAWLEDLLDGFAFLLRSFDRLLDSIPLPPRRFVPSSAELLDAYIGLLNGFGAILARYSIAPRERIDSFEDLLHSAVGLLDSFEDLLKLYRPLPRRWARQFEDLLRSFDDLPRRFGELILPWKDQEDLPVSFILSYGQVLDGEAALLKSFARLLARYPVPPLALLESFEDLLHRLIARLDEYIPFVFFAARGATARQFEWLLHGLQALLGRFEDLLRRLRPLPLDLLVSFEALIKETQILLFHFETLLKQPMEDPGNPFYLEELRASFDLLVEEHAGLVESLEDLNDHLPELPDSMLLSDIEVLNGLQELLLSQIDLRARGATLTAGPAVALTGSAIEANTLVRRLASLVAPRQDAGDIQARYAALVSAQTDIARQASALLSRSACPSAAIRNAVQALGEIQS